MPLPSTVYGFPYSIIQTDPQTFATVFDTYTTQGTVCAQPIAEAVNSAFGMNWIDRNGTFRYVNRGFWPTRQTITPQLSLTDGDAYDSPGAGRDVSTVINQAIVTAHPRSTSGSVTTLGSIVQPQQIPAANGAGSQSITVILTYHDATGKTVGGTGIVALVAGTDYVVTQNADGTGTVYTGGAGLTVTTDLTQSSQASITFTNTYGLELYATVLQVRGQAITTYSPVVTTLSDATSAGRYGVKKYSRDLFFSSDSTFAQKFAQYILYRYKIPYGELSTFSFQNAIQCGGGGAKATDLLSLEIGSVISINQNQLGGTALKHVLIGISYQIDPHAGNNAVQMITFNLRRLDLTTYSIYDTSVYDSVDTYYI